MKSRDISHNSTRGSFCVSQNRRRIRVGFLEAKDFSKPVVGIACGGTTDVRPASAVCSFHPVTPRLYRLSADCFAMKRSAWS
jgi:hypothetical protein